jgi:hypothetical protein
LQKDAVSGSSIAWVSAADRVDVQLPEAAQDAGVAGGTSEAADSTPTIDIIDDGRLWGGEKVNDPRTCAYRRVNAKEQ